VPPFWLPWIAAKVHPGLDLQFAPLAGVFLLCLEITASLNLINRQAANVDTDVGSVAAAIPGSVNSKATVNLSAAGNRFIYNASIILAGPTGCGRDYCHLRLR
jgi:hypothetical protein